MNVRVRESALRLYAVMKKEFIQMRRDKPTMGLIIGVPLIQLILFGFAIDFNPRSLPTAIVGSDHSIFAQRILTSMQNSTYFSFVSSSATEEEARTWLKRGRIQFAVSFPPNFSHDLVKGLKPKLLLQTDASDPAATTRAISVFRDLAYTALQEELVGPLHSLVANDPPYTPIVHAIYNPLAITAYNIVPGLLGVVLTMTLVVITALAITREFERGTMENLLSTPLRPLEVMIGKIVPYIVIGYIQVTLILLMAKGLFGVPMHGSLTLLYLFCLPFIAANLSMGLTFSTLAANQLQAVQSSMFFFLPSILLSGFMFPFRGMPDWAQWVGNVLPLTHFLVIVRGILLKGNGFLDLWRESIPILIFTLVVMFISFKSFRKTLD